MRKHPAHTYAFRYIAHTSLTLIAPIAQALSPSPARRYQAKRFWACAILFLLLDVGYISPVQALVSGYATIKGGGLNGFVYDSAASSESLLVKIYVDGPKGVGTLVQTLQTTILSTSDNSQYQISGYHAFKWALPSALKISLHIWYVYAVGMSGETTLVWSLTYPVIYVASSGAPQTVVSYEASACDSMDFIDHPPRAFRTADGNVSLIASWINVRRSVGPTLDTVQHQCAIIHSPIQDTSFWDFNYWQWLQAPYTLDGKIIYNITHNEWYGELVDSACNFDQIDSWVSAITLTISYDLGNSFFAPQDYIIRNPSSAWSNSFPCTPTNPTRYGDVGGSNIIQNGGYFYKYFVYETEPSVVPAQSWQCVMRTTNLASASSWQIWTGAGWVASKEAPCGALAGLSSLRSVTYNTFLRLYVGIEYFSDGVYFTVSSDLLNWTTISQIYLPGLNISTTPYDVLLDPTDTTLNFERTGQNPYLYYAQFYSSGVGRDTMRIPIHLSLLDP